MSEREAFGPNLRRVRVQRGISIERIATATNIPADVWHALERDDFAEWPTGIYARAYVRAYAEEIGVDPKTTVDEFCRQFSQGDRRAERMVREQAALIGHNLRWKDDLVGLFRAEDRRATAPKIQEELPPLAATRTGRVVAATADACVTLIAAAAASAALPLSFWVCFSIAAMLYHGVAMVALGCTPAVWMIETHLTSRHASPRRPGSQRFLRLLRGSAR